MAEVVEPGQALSGMIDSRVRTPGSPFGRRGQQRERRHRDLGVDRAHRFPRGGRATGRLADSSGPVLERAAGQHTERVGSDLGGPIVTQRLDE